MIPATAAPPHSSNTLDRIAFCKSVREKRKQLQLNHYTNGKDNVSSSTENAFLTQMLQSSSNSATSSPNSSSLNVPPFLRKGNISSSSLSSSHRTATSTLTNILPALLNGTLQSPRENSPSGTLTNLAALNSPTSTNTTDTLVDMKYSASLPVSPAAPAFNNKNNNSLRHSPNHDVRIPTNYSPPRCRSYPMTDMTQRTSPSISSISPSEKCMSMNRSFPSPTSCLLAPSSSCPLLATMNTTMASTIMSSTSPSLDDMAPKIVRSASVKSCASDSGVSSSSPLSDNNIVHVFRTNQNETNHQPQISNGSRKRKSLAHFYDELDKDKKFSSEATVTSGFSMPTPATNNNIPYSQQEALAIGYAQYALMHTLTQQFRVNYPAALLHAASGYLPLTSPMMAAAAAAVAAAASVNNSNTNGHKSSSSSAEKFRERRKPQQQPESDNNNNHIQSNSSLNDQPYRRETYQTLLESSRLLGQHQQQKLLKPVPIDLRKNNGTNRTIDNSPIQSNYRYSSSSSSASPPSSPHCLSPPKSITIDPNNDFVCIPKKLMPVIGARINDWLERNVNFALSLSVIQDTLENDKDKYLIFSRVWHRLLLTSMIENSFEIYVTKDLQITNDLLSSLSTSPSTTIIHPTENDVKQIESLINRGKTLEIDEIGFNLIREMIIYKEGKTLFNNLCGSLFEKAECQTQTKLMKWCSTRVKYSKVVFFLCNIYQVKEDIFERLFCAGSMHQSTPIHIHLQRLLQSSNSMDI
ncbi:unnamed protein product [Rotaria socialis]|uniref:NR LBD domain-containing protein n=2 Tax=Rotaria socialis TaxID=392032 RepID=A0A817RA39_9BILA|nr:unnamed protein product [Rotaria socialis]CAF4535890.1 unnamed protein product [Rotaria socialis]